MFSTPGHRSWTDGRVATNFEGPQPCRCRAPFAVRVAALLQDAVIYLGYQAGRRAWDVGHQGVSTPPGGASTSPAARPARVFIYVSHRGRAQSIAWRLRLAGSERVRSCRTGPPGARRSRPNAPCCSLYYLKAINDGSSFLFILALCSLPLRRSRQRLGDNNCAEPQYPLVFLLHYPCSAAIACELGVRAVDAPTAMHLGT